MITVQHRLHAVKHKEKVIYGIIIKRTLEQ